ncbi:armadillo-type protein [Sporodiniella umbellata]|nr:armadillo-type protein [Sporodiniella umbellata]
MALNDLISELQKSTFVMESIIEGKVVQAVLQLMNDKNSEVQNLAVKCLSPLVKHMTDDYLIKMIDRIDEYTLQTKNEELRGIASVSLKTVISNARSFQGPVICEQVIPKMLRNIQSENSTYEMEMDTLDILSEVSTRFGTQITLERQTDIQKALLPLLHHPRPAIRKRTTVAIGHLVVHTSDSLFQQLIAYLLEGLSSNSESSEKQRTLVQCTSVLSRHSTARMGKHLPDLIPTIISFTKSSEDDDELREICLQTLESFLYRCPKEVSPYVSELISLALEYIKYDPNFAGDDDEDEDLEEDSDSMSGDEDDEYDDIVDYSDNDDDMSWKVRRSSAKVLHAVIETRMDLLQQIYENVAPVLINRFKEREESVRSDVLQTFVVLLRQTSATGERGDGYQSLGKVGSLSFDGIDIMPAKKLDSSHVEIDGSRKSLATQTPKLCRALAKQASSKSIQTRQICFQLLRELIIVLHGGLQDQVELFIPTIVSSLSGASSEQHPLASSSNLKIEILSFLRVFVRNHLPGDIQQQFGKLSSVLIQSISDKYYKITVEAFLVSIEFIKALRPIYLNPDDSTFDVSPINPENVPFIQEIYTVILKILGTSEVDQEVKEKSIVCLGAILIQAGDAFQSQQAQACDVLLERLRNEVTRLVTIKTLAVVAQSPVVVGDDFQNFVSTAVSELTLLLRKNNRNLRITSLECLCILIHSLSRLLAEIPVLISDSDLHLLPLALQAVEISLTKKPQSIADVKKSILPALFQLTQSPLLQGSALQSLLSLFATLSKASPSDYSFFIMNLVDPIWKTEKSTVSAGNATAVTNKQYLSTTAQCVAVLVANNEEKKSGKTIHDCQTQIMNTENNESVKYFSLMTLGEVGRRINLSEYEHIDEQVMQQFDAQSEEVKFAAAFALGNICVGNVPRYLPLIVQQIRDSPKRRYLLLHALKEIITRYNENKASLGDTDNQIWSLLLENSESDQEEGTRTVIAECLGKFALSNPSKFLPQLEERLSWPSTHLRAAVATSVKYAVVDPSRNYDEYLKPIIKKTLKLLEDSDLNVRRLALLTLNSAALRKPYLIKDILSSLVPLLYQETVIREELIHTVEMGPFKHKVDDGLEIRKAAYECMYALLNNSLEMIDVYGFLERVIAALDDQHDIKMLAYLMLIRLGKVAPSAVTQKLDDLVEPLKTTLDFKMRSNAVKQEVEKNQELIRADLRCILSLSILSDEASSPQFFQFLQEVKTGPLSGEFNAIVEEAESREYRMGDFMDLS